MNLSYTEKKKLSEFINEWSRRVNGTDYISTVLLMEFLNIGNEAKNDK